MEDQSLLRLRRRLALQQADEDSRPGEVRLSFGEPNQFALHTDSCETSHELSALFSLLFNETKTR